MKYFWFIFAVYIFALASTPCCEDEQIANSSLSTMVEGHHEDDSHEHSVCSPFCTCTACGVHACDAPPFQTPQIQINLLAHSDQKTGNYQSDFTSGFETSIWQPPQNC